MGSQDGGKFSVRWGLFQAHSGAFESRVNEEHDDTERREKSMTRDGNCFWFVVGLVACEMFRETETSETKGTDNRTSQLKGKRRHFTPLTSAVYLSAQSHRES